MEFMKMILTKVRFSGVGQEYQGGSQTMTTTQQGTIFGRGQMSNGEEYDASYAATVAAVAYAIAEREEKLASQEKLVPERLPSQKNPAAINEPTAAPSPKSPPRTGESMKKPRQDSKISRWFSGKEPVEDDDDDNDDDNDEKEANVSMRRPLKPPQKKPEGVTSGQRVADSTSSVMKDPSFARRSLEKKQSKKLEQEQETIKPAPDVRPTSSFPRERRQSKKFEQDQEDQRAPPTGRPTSSYSGRGSVAGTASAAVSSEAEMMADAWEKEKLAKIKKQYEETMQTIAEWEAEKKDKARRQRDLKERDSERKRAKALEEYNEEMRRINKVAAASRLAAEEKRRNAEWKVREKAERIRSTGKLPNPCACF